MSVIIGCLLVGTLLAPGCAREAVRPDPLLPVLQREAAVTSQLPERVERQFAVVEDRQVTLYLSQLGQALAAQVPELRGRALRVSLIAPLVRGGTDNWESFALPSGQIYLSIGLVRHLQFENELAAAVAVQVAHLARNHLSQKLRALPAAGEDPAATLGPRELADLFRFSAATELEASGLAADLLYKGGYDPRGVASLWDELRKRSSAAPYSPDTLAQLAEGARQVLAQYAPLRNPIVRSTRFVTIHQRIKKL